MLASLKSLSMPADDTGTLKMIFAHTFSLASLLNFQKPVALQTLCMLFYLFLFFFNTGSRNQLCFVVI